MTLKPRSRNVCVLGGTGFVGRAIATQLVRQGYRVTIPTRNRQRNREMLVLPGCELIGADVHDEQALTALLRDTDAVINLVGILNERGRDGSEFRHVHVELVDKVIRACHENGVPRLLHMSALKAHPERGPSHYLKTKGEAEQLIQREAGDDLRWSIFRPSTIFGERDSFVNRFAGLLKWLPVLPLACADARMAPVYVRDVAEAFVKSLDDSDAHGVRYELCGPDIYTLGDVVTKVKRALGVRRAVIPLPRPLGKAEAWVGDYLLPGKPFSLDNFRSLSVATVCTDNGLDRLGIRPTPFDAVLPDIVARRVRRRGV